MTARNGLPPGIEDKLDESLALLAAGIPLETVLNRAGDDAEILHPLLQIAQDTRTLQPAIPIPPPNASLQKMLNHGQTLAAASSAQPGPLAGLINIFKRLGQPVMMLSFRTAVLATFIIVAFLFGTVFGGGLTFAAQDSLPGEQIYPLKRLGETIRLGLTWDTINREKLIDTYSQRRLLETELLLEQGQEAKVGLTGTIETIDDDTLSLGGLIIQISPDTVINGTLTTGARVQIEAITRPPNVLIAITLTVIEAGPPTPVFTSTPTPTSTTSPVPTNTPTVTPTVEKAQTGDTLNLPPTATATPTPTTTATPTATAEINDDFGVKDNDNSDNSNDENNSGSSNDNDDNSNDNDDNENNNEDENDNTDDNENDDNSSDDNSGSGSSDDNSDDDNSGSSNDDGDEDNSGSSSDSDNSGSGSVNSGSVSDSNDDNSGSGSSDDRADDDND